MILADLKHEECDETKAWVESQKGGPFDPEQFDPVEVVFSNLSKRLKESIA